MHFNLGIDHVYIASAPAEGACSHCKRVYWSSQCRCASGSEENGRWLYSKSLL
jgi:hypothetical protein